MENLSALASRYTTSETDPQFPQSTSGSQNEAEALLALNTTNAQSEALEISPPTTPSSSPIENPSERPKSFGNFHRISQGFYKAKKNSLDVAQFMQSGTTLKLLNMVSFDNEIQINSLFEKLLSESETTLTFFRR